MNFPQESLFRQICGTLFVSFLACIACLLYVLPLPPSLRAGIGFGLGGVFLLPGVWLSRYQLMPGKSLLCGGIMFLFTTAVALFPQIMPGRPWAGPCACAALLVLFALLAYRASSRLAGLLVVLFGVGLGYLALPRLSPVIQASCVSLAAFLFVAWLFLWWAHRPCHVFSELSLALVYGAFCLFGTASVPEERLALAFLILALLFVYAFLTLLVLQFSLKWNRSGRLFAAINALGFCVSLWRFAPDTPWLAPTVLLVSGVVAAGTTRRYERLSALTGFYMGQITLTLALLVLLTAPAGYNLIIVALLCLLPAALGLRHSHRIYRQTEYGLILTVLAATFLTELPRHSIMPGVFTFSSYWLFILVVAAVFILIGRLHHYWSIHGSVRSPETLLTLENEQKLLGLTHLFAASLLIMLHTILQRNDSESLPMLLALQGIFFLGVGMLFLTPELALIGMVPVMVGHACYYACSYLVPLSAETVAQSHFSTLVLLMAITALLALLSDRQLGKRSKGKPLFGERFLGMLPYLPVILPPAYFLVQGASGMWVAAGAGIVGIAGLSLPGKIRRAMPGLSGWGYTGAFLSLGICLHALLDKDTPTYSDSAYLPTFLVCLAAMIFLERALTPAATGNRKGVVWMTSICCLAITAIGIAGLYRWNDSALFTVSLVLLALLLGLAGFLFRVRPYYYAALLVAACAAAWLLLTATGAFPATRLAGVSLAFILPVTSAPE